MVFDREALRGIFFTLSSEEKAAIGAACERCRVRMEYGKVIDEDLRVVQDIMTNMGFIARYKVATADIYAEEYEEAMMAEELMHGSRSAR